MSGMNRWILAAVLLWASPAVAQDAEPLPSPEQIRSGDSFTIGLGAGLAPDYEGSNDYRLIPGGAIRGKVSGLSFSTRGTYLYVDAVSLDSGNVDFDIGPIVGVRLNRTGKIKDDFVDRLPGRKTAVEVGGFAGVSFKALTNPYDRLGLRLDVVKDVANAHESTVFTPNLEFSTPLSRTLFVGASLSADLVSDRYADYYFSISPAEAGVSGLPAFDADGGMKNWKIGLLANQSLSGDLRRGWSLFAIANHSRLLGDFKRSPIVSQRGSASQWFGAAGLAYSF
jgi:outer membrane scaffolding protein for murein synthesis (MipA/OmpV family)